ncbi:MAG: hypothetical protein JXK07_10275, partial [Spirochaetes bacterium]|nr:hypothetical protein [Spirochaetota bacterium]
AVFKQLLSLKFKQSCHRFFLMSRSPIIRTRGLFVNSNLSGFVLWVNEWIEDWANHIHLLVLNKTEYLSDIIPR